MQYYLENLFNEKHLYLILRQFHNDFIQHIDNSSDFKTGYSCYEEINDFKSIDFDKVVYDFKIDDKYGYDRIFIELRDGGIKDAITFEPHMIHYRKDINYEELFKIGAKYNIIHLMNMYVESRIMDNNEEIRGAEYGLEQAMYELGEKKNDKLAMESMKLYLQSL